MNQTQIEYLADISMGEHFLGVIYDLKEVKGKEKDGFYLYFRDKKHWVLITYNSKTKFYHLMDTEGNGLEKKDDRFIIHSKKIQGGYGLCSLYCLYLGRVIRDRGFWTGLEIFDHFKDGNERERNLNDEFVIKAFEATFNLNPLTLIKGDYNNY